MNASELSGKAIQPEQLDYYAKLKYELERFASQLSPSMDPRKINQNKLDILIEALIALKRGAEEEKDILTKLSDELKSRVEVVLATPRGALIERIRAAFKNFENIIKSRCKILKRYGIPIHNFSGNYPDVNTDLDKKGYDPNEICSITIGYLDWEEENHYTYDSVLPTTLKIILSEGSDEIKYLFKRNYFGKDLTKEIVSLIKEIADKI